MARTGARGKYRPEVVEDIILTLERTGCDRSAYEAGKISKFTYFKWQEKHADFAAKVARAKEFYRQHLPVRVRRDATERLSDLLRNGVTEQWIKKRVVKDGAGNVVLVEETQSQVKRPAPPWVYNRIFGKDTQVTEAMQVLLSEGVALPEQAEIVKRGLEQMDRELKKLAERVVTVDKVEETPDEAE